MISSNNPSSYAYCDRTVAFTPKTSNKSGSKLEALGYGELRIAGGDLFDMDMTETFNPSQYKLTLLDGTEYIWFCRSRGSRFKSAYVSRLFKRPTSRTGWQLTWLCLVGSTALF